jgi:hypothetical protein
MLPIPDNTQTAMTRVSPFLAKMDSLSPALTVAPMETLRTATAVAVADVADVVAAVAIAALQFIFPQFMALRRDRHLT